ncbi:MAG TPA: fumarylacetoacetate hydrolase family protein [Actinomycetes bacterium]|jgi:2-keto-4-pentenoate hydratase|nr:fumarylacetoacetate hydrolase family protein [Actinomycetes bacterium]
MSDPVHPTQPVPQEIVTKLAERLRACYASGEPVPPIREELPEGDVPAAYRVQEANTEHWLAAGRRLVGRKIGLTAAAIQRQLGVDQPDFGMLFADMAVDNGATVAAGRLLQPRVEAEVAFVLGRDLAVPQPTIVDVIGAVEYAMAAIEIVDSRIAGWQIGIVDTVADNASSAMFVLGTTLRSLRDPDLDLRLAGMVMERHGEPVVFGAGAACLGNPLNALRWLAATMAEAGRPLAAGDVVLSGALGPMLPVAPGDRFEARISGLGSVRVGFA